jgi:glycosyltransferase involved in cell wall biosynthesis
MRGGGSLFTRYFAEHIRDRVPEARVAVSLRTANLDAALFEDAALPVMRVEIGSPGQEVRRPFAAVGALRSHLGAVRAFRPDLVVVTMNSPLCWPFVGLLKRDRIRIAYVAHDPEPHPGDYARGLQRMTQASLLRWADRVVALSHQVGERLRARLGARGNAVRVIPLETVVPLRRTDPVPAAGNGEPVRLLFLGRLLAYKGLPELVEALRPLRELPGWSLTIAGHGPFEGELLAAFEGWHQVDLRLGWQTDETIETLLAEHHLLLCPYGEASQSGVVALALAWGLPALVTPAGALPEQIGEGEAGIVAPGADAASIRAALEAAISSPERLAALSAGAIALMRRRHADTGWRDLVLEDATP